MNFIKTFLAAILAFVVGSVLVVFLWIFILLGIAGSMEKSVAVHPESILKLDFSEVLTDAPSSDPFAGFDFATLQSTRMLPLMKALRALEAAKDDPRIKGIYLRMNGNGGVAGSALLEELREAIVDFKQSGKFVVAYNETYSQGQYYLASAADRIYMQPEGAMDWSGLSFNLAFYKGLLDKLDVKAEVFRPTACKYKSAVEPYILSKMSDANREQMQELVNSMWNTIAASVAEARGIDLETLNRITDKLEVSLPEDALEHGFVDSLVYEDQMDDVFAQLGVQSDSDGQYNFITLGEYASQVGADLKNISADQVAVVYADGAIVDGEGFGCHLARNGAAQGRETRHRLDGFLCCQRRLLYLVPGRCHCGRQTDPDGFHRCLRHVPQYHRRPEEQVGHHVRRREEQYLGRHGHDFGPYASRKGFDHARRG